MAKITSTQDYDTYTLSCYDPYGHWKISYAGVGGQIPKKLEGFYTSASKAKDAIEAYKRQLDLEKDMAKKQRQEEALKPENFKFKKPKEEAPQAVTTEA